MQLDDDSLFAIYYRFDPQGTGGLDYHRVMRELVREGATDLACSSHMTTNALY